MQGDCRSICIACCMIAFTATVSSFPLASQGLMSSVLSNQSDALAAEVTSGNSRSQAPWYYFTRDHYIGRKRRISSTASPIATSTSLALTTPISILTSTTSTANQPPTTSLTTITPTTTTPYATTSSTTLTSSTAPTSPILLLNHGGRILPTVVNKNIFWGTSWATYTGDKITGMDNFSSAWNNSAYARTTLEYYGSNGQITPFSIHQGHVVDTTTASGGGNSNTILAEVCKMITNPDPSGKGFYAVLTDVARGSANYCAYHVSGACSGVHVQFAFFWKLDGDSGCDPQSSVPGHSQGLAALANVYAHELAEATTDPDGSTWYDASGSENADKCAWTFISPFVTMSDGSQWKLQSEWSNRAYLAGTGYPNYNGDKGCIESA